MGQGLSCRVIQGNRLFLAAQIGDLERVETLVERKPRVLEHRTVYDRLSALHIAASNGRIEVLSMILNQSVHPDVLNRHKQTPLMLAAMHGKISCVQKLLQAGANILMFDSLHGRTCLHYAAYYGHSDCLQAILSAAQSTPVADSWGFARFVNVRDGNGATPLHLAARQRRHDCVHILLDNGGLVCASTERYCCPGSTPLHLAARGGSLDCVRGLLAWGADRHQRDSSGRMPYIVAMRHKHMACAALLNPTSAEPLVWPSPLKFISELNPEAKILLERALMETNRAREKETLKGTIYSSPSPAHSDGWFDGDTDEVSESELCCICFDQVCTIEVQNCGHQMCAHCTLALCCHTKPNPSTSCLSTPVCPFCRTNIGQLVVAKIKNDDLDTDYHSKQRKSWRSSNFSEGSSSFKGLSAVGSFGKMGGRGSGRIANSEDCVDKP
ncbi:putative E3 ubiquitin-protein ligase XBAT31 [Tasmannia lanceolata]|uniref:putative E3 ubiquitin-protein ligase XBAT31 n=1 Tax=Tasmannia lanceolata TaxID=3420 RepID=UPI0040635EF2